MERAGDQDTIWSDEKVLTIQAVTNQQSDSVHTTNANAVPGGSRVQFRRQKSAGAVVRAAVASDGSKSPLLFVEEGVRVISDVCLQMLQGGVLPKITEHLGTSYILPKMVHQRTHQMCHRNDAVSISSFFRQKRLATPKP